MKALKTRIEALEGTTAPFVGPAIWLQIGEGETFESGVAEWEVENGPRKPGQCVIAWIITDPKEAMQ